MSQNPPTKIVITFDGVNGRLAEALRTDLDIGLRHDHRGVARVYSPPIGIRLVLADSAQNADIVIKHPTSEDETTRVIKRLMVRRQQVLKEKYFSLRRAFQEPLVVLIPECHKDCLEHVATLHGEVLAAAVKLARRKEAATAY